MGQKRGRDAGDDLLDDGALPKKKVRGHTQFCLFVMCVYVFERFWRGAWTTCGSPSATGPLILISKAFFNHSLCNTCITIARCGWGCRQRSGSPSTAPFEHTRCHSHIAAPFCFYTQVRLGLPATQWITVYNAHRPMKQRYHYNVANTRVDQVCLVMLYVCMCVGVPVLVGCQ